MMNERFVAVSTVTGSTIRDCSSKPRRDPISFFLVFTLFYVQSAHVVVAVGLYSYKYI